MDIDNILISNKISSGEKSYKYLIGYMDDDYKFYKIKPFSITLSKSNAYVKYYDRCIFWLKLMNYWKYKMMFWIKSAIKLKKNLIVNPSTVTNF